MESELTVGASESRGHLGTLEFDHLGTLEFDHLGMLEFELICVDHSTATGVAVGHIGYIGVIPTTISHTNLDSAWPAGQSLAHRHHY